MPKVVPTAAVNNGGKNAAVAAATSAAAEITEVYGFVPPLPPTLPNNDEGDVSPAAAKLAAVGNVKGINSERKTTFYAVRVGYVACPSRFTKQCDDIGEATSSPTAPSSRSSSCGHVSTIRSAIFLRWEDVQQFVEFQEEPPPCSVAVAAADEDKTVHRVPFHHNVEYKEFDEMEKAIKYLQRVSVPSTKALIRNKVASPIQAPPKAFHPPTKKWERMYQSALDYKSTHGHLNMTSENADSASESDRELFKWVKYQRSSYKAYLEDPTGRNHSMTLEKVNRLKEAGFEWIMVEKKNRLFDEANIYVDGKRKRGRSRKSDSSSPPDKMVKESKKQKKDNNEKKKRNGHSIRQKWLDMLELLKAYKSTHGTVDIAEDDTSEERKELKSWIKAQHTSFCRWKAGGESGMTQEKVDLLTELGIEFTPSWDEMFAKVITYKSQHGHINVTSEEDAALAAWMVKQNRVLGRQLMGRSTRLKKDQVTRMLNVGFDGGSQSKKSKPVSGALVAKEEGDGTTDFDARWDEMFEKLQEYKKENGNCSVPSSAGTDLSNWVAAQRRMYGKLISGKQGTRSFLDASKMQRLTDLGFQFRPRGSYYSWDDQMAELRKFKEEHGDLNIPVNHERLGSFVKLTRRDYKKYVQGKKCGMTEAREVELRELGFVFEGGKTPVRKVTLPKSWEERFQDLIEYKKQFGDTVVPQNSGRLGMWVHAQRVHYKKFKKGKPSQMTAEKALKLSEIGFCFDAGDRFRGGKARGTDADEQVEVHEAMQNYM